MYKHLLYIHGVFKSLLETMREVLYFDAHWKNTFNGKQQRYVAKHDVSFPRCVRGDLMERFLQQLFSILLSAVLLTLHTVPLLVIEEFRNSACSLPVELWKIHVL